MPALCTALSKSGVDISLLAFSASPDYVDASFTPYLMVPLPGTRQGVTPSYIRTLLQLVRDHDLVHIHSLWNAPTQLAAMLARRTGVPYVVSPRGMLQTTSLSRKARVKDAFTTLVKKVVTSAAGLHLLTESELADSRVFIPTSANVLVAPNGVDIALKEQTARGAFRSAHPMLGDRPFVLFLGRLHWSKDLDVQLDACERAAARNADVMWVLVGPDEGEWSSLSSAIAARGLTERVVWVGPVNHDRALEAVGDANALFLTSRHEAHSMAMNEALALGTPLILTPSVGFPELAGTDAALVGESAEDLSNALLRIIEDADLADRLGEQGRRFARDHLSWPAIAGRMSTFYAGIIEGPR